MGCVLGWRYADLWFVVYINDLFEKSILQCHVLSIYVRKRSIVLQSPQIVPVRTPKISNASYLTLAAHVARVQLSAAAEGMTVWRWKDWWREGYRERKSDQATLYMFIVYRRLGSIDRDSYTQLEESQVCLSRARLTSCVYVLSQPLPSHRLVSNWFYICTYSSIALCYLRFDSLLYQTTLTTMRRDKVTGRNVPACGYLCRRASLDMRIDQILKPQDEFLDIISILIFSYVEISCFCLVIHCSILSVYQQQLQTEGRDDCVSCSLVAVIS
jgi:hypothetical protein